MKFPILVACPQFAKEKVSPNKVVFVRNLEDLAKSLINEKLFFSAFFLNPEFVFPLGMPALRIVLQMRPSLPVYMLVWKKQKLIRTNLKFRALTQRIPSLRFIETECTMRDLAGIGKVTADVQWLPVKRATQNQYLEYCDQLIEELVEEEAASAFGCKKTKVAS